MSDPNAPPPSYDELFNKGGVPSAPPPAVSATYINTSHDPTATVHTGGYGESATLNPAPYPVQPYPSGQYGAPTQPGYPPTASYVPGQTHPGYGPNAPIHVPNQPYGQPCPPGSYPTQYNYNTVNASAANAGYNTTPLAYGAQGSNMNSELSQARTRRCCLIIVMLVVFILIPSVIFSTIMRR